MGEIIAIYELCVRVTFNYVINSKWNTMIFAVIPKFAVWNGIYPRGVARSSKGLTGAGMR